MGKVMLDCEEESVCRYKSITHSTQHSANL